MFKAATAAPPAALLSLNVQLTIVASGFIPALACKSIAPPETEASLSANVQSLIVATVANSNLIAPPLARPLLEAELLVNVLPTIEPVARPALSPTM